MSLIKGKLYKVKDARNWVWNGNQWIRNKEILLYLGYRNKYGHFVMFLSSINKIVGLHSDDEMTLCEASKYSEA
jgi:hypothetical protein